MTVAPYGSWSSPLSAADAVAAGVRLSQLQVDGDVLYWLEQRPLERGRCVVVAHDVDGNTRDVTPAEYNVRSKVHEYGGGAYVVNNNVVYFANADDQRWYCQRGDVVRAITPDDGRRFADVVVDTAHERLIAVCEKHVPGADPVNCLSSIRLEDRRVEVLHGGHDFYASPRPSADGKQLAWLAWDHPNMPWDGTVLYLADIDDDGSLADIRVVAGGGDESIFQPEWMPDGSLCFVSDRNGWWNLYRLHDGETQALAPMEAEFGLPQWVFGMRTYAIDGRGGIWAACCTQGVWQLGCLSPADAESAARWDPVESLHTDISDVQIWQGTAVAIAASPVGLPAVTHWQDKDRYVTLTSDSPSIPLDNISAPEAIQFKNRRGETVHAFFYPPTNPGFTGPENERPPLIVRGHSGPTGAATAVYNNRYQYWTSRGFAIVDVNYGGSTGYGRRYRARLDGNWGVVDVEDCIDAAQHLVQRGDADGDRLVIAGSSAGGYTALCALTFHHNFKAGSSSYGIGDLEALLHETHKFEARYFDRLVGPWPDARERYRSRSPLQHVENLSCPVIFFQGTDDKVVPPSQAEAMVSALQQKRVPVAYVLFEDEGHGFRQAANQQRLLEAELLFFGRILRFTPADKLPPVQILNLE